MRYLIATACLLLCSIANGEPFAELNAQRAHFGLPPLIEDAELTRFAQMKAEWQARYKVNLARGYNGHEGPSGPGGCTEGTGQVDPMWGWATCAVWIKGVYRAGAGIAIGDDGKRYMCLIVRCPNNAPEVSSNDRNMLDTSHMTPNAPRISFVNQRVDNRNYQPTYAETIGLAPKSPVRIE